MRPLLPAVPLALAACAPTAQQAVALADRAAADQVKLDKTLAGLVPGKPSRCLPLSAGQYRTEGIGRTILYKISRGQVYRSDTAGGCERIGRGDILVTRQVGGQLCQGDIATTIDQTSRFQTGSCSFGPFVPYRRP
ncbi:MAG TPA: hypothetical protein VFQ57_08010 [Sphingomonas sp.]|nr:hypothetical protein [Sphingomonas sp.]